jgi:hypothetical protein
MVHRGSAEGRISLMAEAHAEDAEGSRATRRSPLLVSRRCQFGLTKKPMATGTSDVPDTHSSNFPALT